MRTILIATTLLVASFSASFAQQPQSYHPGPAKASTVAPVGMAERAVANKAEQAPAPKRDFQAEANQRFASWKDAQKSCFGAIGMREGTDFRFNPQDETDVQVARRARLASSGFDQKEIDKCIALINK